ncbi:uncharacterized protein V6R79_009049 [Siganus canaliculatus]
MIFLFLLLVYLHGASAKLHSLKNFYSASAEVQSFPEFVAFGLVDDVHFVHYDSDIRRVVPRQDWVHRATEIRADFWKWQTNIVVDRQHKFKADIGILEERFNATGGIFQQMLGCEWDDESDEAVGGFWHFGYNGEDLMTFDLKTETWIAAKPQAVLTKRTWDEDKADVTRRMYALTQRCTDWVKKFVGIGRSSLTRTDLPSVTLLQKTSSSPVRCFATGFYPKATSLVWRRDGVEIHKDVVHGEILPNQDGTFQLSVDLNVSSVRAEDWERLDCVFRFSGVEEDHVVTRLDRAGIKTNEEKPGYPGIISGAAAVLVLIIIIIIIAVTGFVRYRQKHALKNRNVPAEAQPMNRQHTPQREPARCVASSWR